MSEMLQKETRSHADAGFFGSRTGWRELKERMLLEPVKGLALGRCVWSLLLFTFVLQVVTGILLTTCYVPSVGTAWQSVKYIQERRSDGSSVECTIGTLTAMVILLLFHLVQVFVWERERPGELTWINRRAAAGCDAGPGIHRLSVALG